MAAEVGAFLFRGEDLALHVPAASEHTPVRPSQLEPQRVLRDPVELGRRQFARECGRCRRTPEDLFERDGISGHLMTHLLSGEDAPDEKVVPDGVRQQQDGKQCGDDQPGDEPAADSPHGRAP